MGATRAIDHEFDRFNFDRKYADLLLPGTGTWKPLLAYSCLTTGRLYCSSESISLVLLPLVDGQLHQSQLTLILVDWIVEGAERITRPSDDNFHATQYVTCWSGLGNGRVGILSGKCRHDRGAYEYLVIRRSRIFALRCRTNCASSTPRLRMSTGSCTKKVVNEESQDSFK